MMENNPFEQVPDLPMETVVAAKGGYEPHPDAYSPRVIVFVGNEMSFYELLRTGEAIPWGKAEPKGFDFWICDCPALSSIGVHRE